MIDFNPHLEILPQAQRRLWDELSQVVSKGFVLYGGTAIALHLGHRNSVDFDFFTNLNFNTETLLSSFSFTKDGKVLQRAQNTLTVITKEDVKISFFGGITFGRVASPFRTQPASVIVASLDDLLATKLKTLFDRIESKDYKDIAAMLRHGINLSKGLASGKAMFGDHFQPSEALKALTYFHGGDLDSLGDSDRSTPIKAAREVHDLPSVQILSHELGCPAEQPEKKRRCRMR